MHVFQRPAMHVADFATDEKEICEPSVNPPAVRIGVIFEQDHVVIEWWAVTGSNCRPPGCKPGALPAELTARFALHQYLSQIRHYPGQ